MRPETLQSLSVGIVFIGLLLAAVGGFGTFHFGRRAARDDEGQRTAAVQTLAEVVSALRNEQSGLLARVSVVEDKVAEAPAPLMAAAPLHPPPAMVFSSPSPPSPIVPSPLTLAPAPPPPMPDVLLPHLPPIAAGPEPTDAGEPPAPTVRPPKMQLSPAAQPPQLSVAVRGDEGPLSFEKRARLVKRLRSHPKHAILIRAAADNAQAVKLAIVLKSVFREAGWSVGEIEMVTRPLPTHTLLLSTGVFPPPKEFVAAYAALAGTGFLVTSDLDPNQGKERVVVSVGPIR